MLRSTSGLLQSSKPALPTASEQSIVEMASINSSLAEDTLKLAQNVLPAFSYMEIAY